MLRSTLWMRTARRCGAHRGIAGRNKHKTPTRIFRGAGYTGFNLGVAGVLRIPASRDGFNALEDHPRGAGQ